MAKRLIKYFLDFHGLDRYDDIVREKIEEAISGVLQFHVVVIPEGESLPEQGDQQTIYLLPVEDPSQGNIYEEYLWIVNDPSIKDGHWELIGTTKTDLSDYYTKEEIDSSLNLKLNVLKAYNNIGIENDNIFAWGYNYNKDIRSFTEGYTSSATGWESHAEGSNTSTNAWASHVEGVGTIASNDAEHAQGKFNVSHTNSIHTTGIGTADNKRQNAVEILNDGSIFVIGIGGYDGSTLNNASTLLKTISNISSSISAKLDKITLNLGTNISITQSGTIDVSATISALGYVYNSTQHSFATGANTTASGWYSHAEGSDTNATGDRSHSEGNKTVASQWCAHAEGDTTIASGSCAHAEGSNTSTNAWASHVEGIETIATNNAEHAQGQYNISNSGTIHSIGIGLKNWETSEITRKNAVEVLNTGEIYINNLGNYNGTSINNVSSLQDVINNKQNIISDLDTIRTKASTALQPEDLASWAKLPNKPTYTALEIGALPNSTVIPSKTSQLTNDSSFVSSEELSSVPDVSILIVAETPIVDKTGESGTAFNIDPNKMYMFGDRTALTINLNPGKSDIVNEYMFQFTSGSSTATTLTVPAMVVWLKEPDIQTGKKYAVSIENNLGIIGEWNNE